MALGAAARPAPAAEPTYAIVVNAGAPVSDLSLEDLRRVFTLRRAFWKPGKPIRLVLPATGQPARAFLLERVCRKSEGELQRAVLESMYRGDIDQAPKVAASEPETLTLVASTENAVGVISAGAAAREGTRVLRIDGKLPSEAGYPLAP
jgi:ABC-type phosphate transport system substrate-binding protein